MENTLATKRLELIAKGHDLKPLPKDIDPALRIPASRRMDAWENLTTGFGSTTTHPVANTQYTNIPKIDSSQLEELYRSDWVSRKGIDAPAEDMTRNGISYQHNDDDEESGEDNGAQKQVEDFDDVLKEKYAMWANAFEAIALARVSGGSVTLFNYDDTQNEGDFADPLNENQVSEIRWIKVIPSWFAIPLTYYRDINHPKWGEPEHYQVVIRSTGGGSTLNVHESRMIRMNGRFTTQTARVQNRGWNDSELQAVYSAIRDYGICVTESNSTMESFTQDYLGLKGLAEKVMLGETDYVLERVMLAHSKLTSNSLSLYDAESETMDRKGTPITGLADLWDRYTEAICGAWGIPRSRFMSAESGSLGGNSAESDTRNYFNRIKSMQEMQARPWINSFMNSVNLAEKMVTELPTYTFNELAEQSDKEKAETRYTQAQTDQIYLQEQVVSAEEVAVSRFSKDETDLETMNIDFKAREEMEDEATPEEVEEMRNTIAEHEFQSAVDKQVGAQANKQIEQTEQEEKKDSAPIIIEHKPQITIESPTVNVEVPEQKDHTDAIDSIKDKVDELKEKLNEDQEVVIDD